MFALIQHCVVTIKALVWTSSAPERRPQGRLVFAILTNALRASWENQVTPDLFTTPERLPSLAAGPQSQTSISNWHVRHRNPAEGVLLRSSA